jgi:hypothetical protein
LILTVFFIRSFKENAMSLSPVKKVITGAVVACGFAMAAASVSAQDVIIHPNAGTFPIANAVEVGPGATIIFHSGVTPAAANPDATRGTPEFYGDTKTQAILGDLHLGVTKQGSFHRQTDFKGADPLLGKPCNSQ